jgi:tRNA(Ile)-lysidine synthase
MALLHALTHWTDSLKVSAIHINHGLRGEYADRDEVFVRSYCAEHGIPLVVVHADVATFALREHLTTEEAGRQVRYEQFEETRRAIGADYVLTAYLR